MIPYLTRSLSRKRLYFISSLFERASYKVLKFAGLHVSNQFKFHKCTESSATCLTLINRDQTCGYSFADHHKNIFIITGYIKHFIEYISVI